MEQTVVENKEVVSRLVEPFIKHPVERMFSIRHRNSETYNYHGIT